MVEAVVITALACILLSVVCAMWMILGQLGLVGLASFFHYDLALVVELIFVPKSAVRKV